MFNLKTSKVKATMNDIVGLDNDVTFNEYLNIKEKLEKAIADCDDKKVDLYLHMLRNQEDMLTRLFKTKLSQHYAYEEQLLNMNKNINDLRVLVEQRENRIDKIISILYEKGTVDKNGTK